MTARDKLVERACRRDEVTADRCECVECRPADRPVRDYAKIASDNPEVAESFGGKPNLIAWLRYLDA